MNRIHFALTRPQQQGCIKSLVVLRILRTVAIVILAILAILALSSCAVTLDTPYGSMTSNGTKAGTSATIHLPLPTGK